MTQTEDVADVLQAEGESGLETVGFSGATVPEVQKRRARPTNTLIFFNWTTTPAINGVYPVPAPYWGNFATLFDGTIIAGTRLDGQGIGFAGNIGVATRCVADGLTGKCFNPVLNNYTPPQYTSNVVGAKGGVVGIDVFFRTSMTNVNVYITYCTTAGAAQVVTIVNNKVPVIGSLVPGIVETKQRPEGYFSGENGVQVFFNPPCAATNIPAGFIDPSSVGVPKYAIVDNGANHLRMDLTP